MEVFVGKCTDDLMHVFKSLDDGASDVIPLCGSDTSFVNSGDEDAFMCDDCLPLFCRAFSIPEEQFISELEESSKEDN